MHTFRAGCFLCYTERFWIRTHPVFSFVRMIDVNFIRPTCYRDIPQYVNPGCSISIIHGGRLGKAFIMFSDTVNILWIFAPVECVNEISPGADGNGTSGPLLFAHMTFQDSQFIWNFKTSELKDSNKQDFRNAQSDIWLDCIYWFTFLFDFKVLSITKTIYGKLIGWGWIQNLKNARENFRGVI